jgi:hypothetical protein
MRSACYHAGCARATLIAIQRSGAGQSRAARQGRAQASRAAAPLDGSEKRSYDVPSSTARDRRVAIAQCQQLWATWLRHGRSPTHGNSRSADGFRTSQACGFNTAGSSARSACPMNSSLSRSHGESFVKRVHPMPAPGPDILAGWSQISRAWCGQDVPRLLDPRGARRVVRLRRAPTANLAMVGSSWIDARVQWGIGGGMCGGSGRFGGEVTVVAGS